MATLHPTRAELRPQASFGQSTGQSSWLSWLWRVLAIGAATALLSGCLSFGFSGDSVQAPQPAPNAVIVAKATMQFEQQYHPTTPMYATLILENTADTSRIIAYRASVNPSLTAKLSAFSASAVLSPVAANSSISFITSGSTGALASAAIPSSLVLTLKQLPVADTVDISFGKPDQKLIANMEVAFNEAMFKSLATANPGYLPVRILFGSTIIDSYDGPTNKVTINGASNADSKITYRELGVDIRSVLNQVETANLASGKAGLSGNIVTATFDLAGLNSAAGPRTIDWTVTEGTTPVFSAKTVCSGVRTGETCTSSNPALSLLIQNPSLAKLNLSFAGRGSGQYNVGGKISYPANAELTPPRAAISRSIPAAIVIAPAGVVTIAAAITTTAVFIPTNTPIEFDLTGSVFPTGSNVYFSLVTTGGRYISIKPTNAQFGQIVTKPKFTFPAKVRALEMVVSGRQGNSSTTIINIEKLFTPVTGGSS